MSGFVHDVKKKYTGGGVAKDSSFLLFVFLFF